ncbi:hypothetical protein DNTS_006462 [Danionella cerebrum]|uniref:peptidylprolyl isomerase n=1 Tax=Danionella cerebrum TaxID=2873325 RepID=A0A553REJ8_9TELE|nr:hypothetical protein DNTS_006462 [Danionella translucida]
MEKIKGIIPDYDERDFMCPKRGSKLASLFGLDQAESQGNESFQFTAPKQPKKTTSSLGCAPQKPCAPVVLYATAVHAFCFVNGQYVKHGKIGAAVLGNRIAQEYNILLYGSKQRHITTAKIHRGFLLTVQPCNYVTFYDDQQQSWSLMFDSGKARPEFCREVCLARWNSEASSESLLFQDLSPGEGSAVHDGDTVEVALSGWVLQNHSFGQKFDPNLGKEKLQRVRLGSGKYMKGLEDGMLGMQKGGRRLLIIPSSMSYVSKGDQNHVPAHHTLVYDVEIQRVKFFKGRQSESGERMATELCTDSRSVEKLQDKRVTDESIAQASNGKLESSKWQTSSDQLKTALISRIAKMGKPMLPFLSGAIPAQPSDSETEDACDSGALCDPCPPHSPPPKPHSREVLMAIEKLSHIVDQLIYKVNDVHNKCHLNAGPFSASSETNKTLYNIKSFVQEMCVNKNVMEKLMETEQRDMDQQQRQGDHLQKVDECGECNPFCTSSSRLPQELVNLQQRAAEIQAELCGALRNKQELCTQISHLEAQLVKQGEKSEQLWKADKQSCKEMKTLLKSMEEEIQDVKAEKQNLGQVLSDKKRKWRAEQERILLKQEEEEDRNQQEILQLRLQLRKARNSTAALMKQVKQVLSEEFQSLRKEFDPQESYSGHNVLEILQNKFKSFTLKLFSEQWELDSEVDEKGEAEEVYLSTQ